MTTEDTELTFVRCPSCRSLVPAVATRCRMCGYSFESGAEADEVEEDASSQSKSRVRQRTISANREQLDELAVGSVETSDSLEADASVTAPSLFPPSEDDELEPLAGDPFASSELKETPEVEAEANVGASILESFSAAILPGAEEGGDVAGVGISVDEPNLFNEEGEQPDVEQSEFQQSEEPVENETEDSPVEQFSSSAEDAPVEESSTPVKKKRRRRRKRKSASERAQNEEVLPTEERIEMNGTPQRAQSRKSKAVSTTDEGVLVGWFVGFADNPKGEAEELRSGKFFIGRQQLRDDDMVIDKEGISTPHCLIAVDGDGTLRVQDLMSENGTLLQRADGGEFEAIGDVVEIEHGDKLRLGSYEVTICLLPTD